GHLGLVERKPSFGLRCWTICSDPIRSVAYHSLGLELNGRTEPLRILCHVPNTSVKSGPPQIASCPLAFIDQYRDAVVKLRRHSGVFARPKDRRGASVRIQAGNIAWCKGKTALGFCCLSRIGK